MTTRIEAESLTRTGSFRLEPSSIASGGNLISFVGGSTNETGRAFGNLNLPSGNYDIIVSYFDENDGAATLQVRLAGQSVDSWTLNQSLNGGGVSNSTRTSRTIANQLINTGDLFEILGTEQGGEYLRVDYIEFRPVSTPTPTPGTLAFSTASYSVNENGTPVSNVTITRSGGSSGAVSVTVTPTAGTATAGSDFNSNPITVSFADGETSKIVTIPIVNDTTVEGNETVNLTLSNPTGGATLGTQAIATLTIVNDDVAPVPGTLAFSTANYSVNENGTVISTVTVTRSGGSDGAVSVTVTPTDETAIAPDDYNPDAVVISFADGETSKTVEIPIVNDNTQENNETLNLTLSNPTGGATLGTQATATLTIVDDDNPGTFAFSSASYSVNEEGTAINAITITRTGGSRGAVSVTVTPTDGTAIAPDDYDPDAVVVSFADGETSKTVTIPITNDNAVEGNETINLTLSNPTGGATLGSRTTATLTIVDDETPGTLAFSSATYSVNENGTAVNAITIARTGGSDGAVSVRVTPTNGTAIAPNDYDPDAVVVSFANGETSKTVTIPITNDNAVEGNETINLTLSNPTGGATLGSRTTATLTVVDDETPGTLAFSSATYSVNENGTAVNAITIARTGGSDGVVSVTLTPSNGTATAPQDFNNSPIVVEFAAGEISKTVTIPIVNDPVFEGNETINLTLSNPTGRATLGTQTTATLTINNDDLSEDPLLVRTVGVDPRGFGGTVESVEFSPNNEFFVAGAGDGKLRLFRTSDGSLVWETVFWSGSLSNKQGEIESVYFSPDGQTIAAGGNGTAGIKVYRASDGGLIRSLSTGEADGMAFSPNGQYFAGPSGGNVRMYNPATWQVRYSNRITHSLGVNSVEFTRDSQFVLTGAADDFVKISRSVDGSLVRSIRAANSAGSVKSVRLSPDETLFATANGDEGVVKIFRFSDGTLVRTISHGSVYLEAVAFSPDGRYLATGAEDGLRIYRTSDYSLVGQYTNHGDNVEYIDFSSDGQYMITGGEDGSVRIWQMPSNVPVGVASNGAVSSTSGDTLTGGVAVNVIANQPGSDTLTGTAAADLFVFNAPGDGIDQIINFEANDRLQISASGFGGGLVAGTTLNGADATGVLQLDAAPTSALATFLYNTSTGVLQFDGDGIGAGSAVTIATLQSNPSLTPTQITLVG
ncbi:PD40 domain-containing protein [Oscillatoria sp. FACHB-1407]|uniref:Calx-beta domain-containing protein n=1 Tax=Oscillatoria sp. FACHB-1407 TaxID=2692847 RepID=UPI00168673F7|nr:Calx-beta domain-containing protein [Oscillatoria sp. FACHB-1407]MBD2460261.1 PD40 domain-containing protein [Oscillatoria sp. FACHB-1407]